MATVAIPGWNSLGLLPPIDSTDPVSAERSPYTVSLLDVVMRFSTSQERRQVLIGLLDYRAALHDMGLTKGFQWLDGSFTEHVEILERRAPRDVDVVTFVHIPDAWHPAEAQLALLEHDAVKSRFSVDSYFVELNRLSSEQIVESSAYWYSMWSHRRNQAWKGYLQVDLAPDQDEDARARLVQSIAQDA